MKPQEAVKAFKETLDAVVQSGAPIKMTNVKSDGWSHPKHGAFKVMHFSSIESKETVPTLNVMVAQLANDKVIFIIGLGVRSDDEKKQRSGMGEIADYIAITDDDAEFQKTPVYHAPDAFDFEDLGPELLRGETKLTLYNMAERALGIAPN